MFFEVDLLQMLDGCRVEVVQFCTKRGCRKETPQVMRGIISYVVYVEK